MTHRITIKDSEFILHPSGSLFWPQRKALLIADLHLGKISHFRKAGVAVPSASISANFLKLEQVVDFFMPETIFFLGDLFHSTVNNEWPLFAEWVRDCPAEVCLITGNHDILSPELYRLAGVKVFRELVLGDFLLTHHPSEHPLLFNFSGHVHPAIRLHGKGKQWLTLPCFFHKPSQMIMPAFGKFTGTYQLVPQEQDCVYALVKDEVIVICD